MPIRKPELDHVNTPLSRLVPPDPKRRPRYRFDRNDRIRYGGRHYVYLHETDGGHVIRQHDGTLNESLTHDEMAKLVADRSFGLDRGWYNPPSVSARNAGHAESLRDLPEEEREHVAWKTYMVRAFHALERAGEATRTDESMAAAVELISDELSKRIGKAAQTFRERGRGADQGPRLPTWKLPCPRTLRSWLKRYKDAGGNPLALRDGRYRSGNRTRRLPHDVLELVRKQCEAYGSEKRPTVAACHEALCAALRELNETRAQEGLDPLPEPSKEVMRCAIASLPAFDTHAARHGIDDARRRFRLVKQSNDVLRPGQRVEIDEWLIDLQKILKDEGIWRTLSDEEKRLFTGRWVICVAIDVATRVILGLMMARNPSASLALATLRMTLIDKSHLVPGARTDWGMALLAHEFVHDGGPAFIAEAFNTAVTDIGSKAHYPPGGMPHLRPYVERVIGTIAGSVPSFLTGRTHSDVVERGDLDPQLRASVTPEEFARVLSVWVVDRYHNGAHLGLGGETPRAAWRRLTEIWGVLPPPGPDALRDVFGTEFKRELSLRGVRFLGLHYADEILGAEILERGLFEVTIRVDEDDLGAVSLWTEGGWRPLPCRTTGLDGVSVETFLAAMKEVRSRFAKASKVTRHVVLAAVSEIQAIAAAAEARAGIVLREGLGPDRIAAEERALLAGYDKLSIDGPDHGDPLDGVIPIGPGDDGDGPDGSDAPSADWFESSRRRFGAEEE